MVFKIKKLTVEVGNKEAVKNLSLSIGPGEINILMGPNGSGKTSLCQTILGNPNYVVKNGYITLNNENIMPLKTEERARRGLFLSFQEPPEIQGISVASFLRTIAGRQKSQDPFVIMEKIREQMPKLGLSDSFLARSVNCGFSGGEKKKNEILQLSALKPKFAFLDEIDSGVDIDSLKIIAKILKESVKNGMGMLVISHSPALGKALKPYCVHIMSNGRIIAKGTAALLKKIEKSGYGGLASAL